MNATAGNQYFGLILLGFLATSHMTNGTLYMKVNKKI